MTADGHFTDPAGDGSVVRRWLARRAAARADRTARAILDGLVTAPPRNLKELERLVGRLDVDMSGPEGRGGGVFRPASPFAPGGMTGDVRLGRLRPGVVRVFVAFAYDPHHGHPRTADALQPNRISVGIDLERGDVRRVLADAFGQSRTIERDGKAVEEFGRWFYLEPWERPTTVDWQPHRPDWAVPPVPAGAAETFLGALVEALAGGGDRETVAANLVPLAAAAGAEISGFGEQLTIHATPRFALGAVASAFGWSDPVAGSGDVHMATWSVGPRDAVHGGPAPTRIGGWQVAAWLDGAPRDAPKVDARVPFPVYDVQSHPGRVGTLIATEAD